MLLQHCLGIVVVVLLPFDEGLHSLLVKIGATAPALCAPKSSDPTTSADIGVS
jgi:hypothetical protein